MNNIIKFDNIAYLSTGTARQQQAYNVLVEHRIMELLLPYSSLLVGTIPINIDIEGSDLDVLCAYQNKKEFVNHLRAHFSTYPNFNLYETTITGNETIIANFMAYDFEVEIFGQQTPVKQQYGYLHMLIEHELLQRKGEAFRQEIISLKKQGLKTEPAFARALKLTGNPYEELLRIDVKQF
ncbi:DUF4269 domain-containing protein [Mucilaginibacter terrae]|uniref:DUF4269 domain-containing protein n=1 Tax=Mucilaginibacter terrae TaxID=1955052 RepID=A0ABU3GY76_9SPHI|nr:DUF4269 domain-containing protein [Mucilaginibacter terrae]MDT3404709.1 hypothetical protein [Mucilaginibacter terrae]